MARWTALLLSLGLCGAWGCAGEAAIPADGVPLVDIDTDATVVARTLGGGVQWDAHEWFDLSDAQWKRLTDRVAFLRLGIIRCMVQAYWYCTGIQDGRPLYVWQQVDGEGKPLRDADGHPVDRLGHRIDHNLKRLGKLYRILDYCQANGVDVLLGEWGQPSSQGWVYPPANHLNGPALGLTVDDPRYASMAAGFVRYLVESRGYTCVRYFNLGNEVNLNYDKARWLQGMRNFHAALREVGMASKVTLVGPDSGYWRDLWYRDTLDGLRDEVGVYDFHWYVSDRMLVNGGVEDEVRLLRVFGAARFPHRPLILGELGIADGVVHDSQTRMGSAWHGSAMASAWVQCARAGAAGCIGWGLDDAIHINGPVPMDYQVHPETRVKAWGMWNSLGSRFGRPADERPRPWYRTWALLSRYFPKGWRIVHSSDTGVPGLTTLAGTGSVPGVGAAVMAHGAPTNARPGTPSLDRSAALALTFVAVNHARTPREVRFRCPNATGPLRLQRFVVPGPEDSEGRPKPDGILEGVHLSRGLSVRVPAYGVVLLTTLDTRRPAALADRRKVRLVDTLAGLENLECSPEGLGFGGFGRHPDHYSAPVDLQSSVFGGDRTRVHRAEDGQPARVTYRLDGGIGDFRIGVYHRYGIRDSVRVEVSPDGRGYREIAVAESLGCETGPGWTFSLLTPCRVPPAGSRFLRVALLPVGGRADTQIGIVELGAGPLSRLEVTGSERVVVTGAVGCPPELPDRVLLWLDHEVPNRAPVKWDAVAPERWRRAGVVTVAGVAGRWGARVTAEVRVADRLDDAADDLGRAWSHTANMAVDGSNPGLLGGDDGRFCRKDAAAGELVYRFGGMRSFEATVYVFDGDDTGGLFEFLASTDGAVWTGVRVAAGEEANPADPKWRRFRLRNEAPLPAGTRFLKVVLRAHANPWIQQLGRMSIRQGIR